MTTLAEVLGSLTHFDACVARGECAEATSAQFEDFAEKAAVFIRANRDALARFELERAARAAIGEDHPVRILTGSSAPEFVSRFTAAVHTSYIIVGADWKPEG